MPVNENYFEGLVDKRCPAFAGETTGGKRLELTAYLGLKPIVLLFLPELARAECRAYLRAFADDFDHYRALDAVVVALTTSISADEEYPFAIIAEAKDIFDQYGVRSQANLAAGVLLVDRYGQVRYAKLAPDCSELPDEPRLAKLLLGFESLCPECGVPEEHWLAAAE